MQRARDELWREFHLCNDLYRHKSAISKIFTGKNDRFNNKELMRRALNYQLKNKLS